MLICVLGVHYIHMVQTRYSHVTCYRHVTDMLQTCTCYCCYPCGLLFQLSYASALNYLLTAVRSGMVARLCSSGCGCNIKILGYCHCTQKKNSDHIHVVANTCRSECIINFLTVVLILCLYTITACLLQLCIYVHNYGH